MKTERTRGRKGPVPAREGDVLELALEMGRERETLLDMKREFSLNLCDGSFIENAQEWGRESPDRFRLSQAAGKTSFRIVAAEEQIDKPEPRNVPSSRTEGGNKELE